MADHGEKPTLAPASDSPVVLPNAESAVCEYGNVVFRASLYMLGEKYLVVICVFVLAVSRCFVAIKRRRIPCRRD